MPGLKIILLFLAAFLIISLAGMSAMFWLVFRIPPLAFFDHLLAQVGVTASVEPNPVNSAAEQLRKKEEELKRMESALKERESRILLQNSSADSKRRALIFGLAATEIMLIMVLAREFYAHHIKHG